MVHEKPKFKLFDGSVVSVNITSGEIYDDKGIVIGQLGKEYLSSCSWDLNFIVLLEDSIMNYYENELVENVSASKLRKFLIPKAYLYVEWAEGRWIGKVDQKIDHRHPYPSNPQCICSYGINSSNQLRVNDMFGFGVFDSSVRFATDDEIAMLEHCKSLYDKGVIRSGEEVSKEIAKFSI